MGSRKLHICPKVTKMGIIGHRIDYNGEGVREPSGTYPARINPRTPPHPPSPGLHAIWTTSLYNYLMQKYKSKCMLTKDDL